MNHLEFKPLIEQLQSRAMRSVVSQYAFKSQALTDYLRHVYSGDPGQDGALLADPVFESMFPWEQAETELEQLRGTLLSPHMMKMLSGFKYPFKHQLAAWRAILEQERSVLISSGTGSGKTECFLVPILEDLVRQQSKQKTGLVGTQAIFLYPLNALINSQQERLSKWTKDLKGKIRFALYNGETKYFATEVSEDQRKHPEQVLSREALWEAPTSILVTNATMLEYMLVRKDDQPIIDQSRGMLKYIVLDEAHTYIGSHAAELSLLLRRVMTAFNVGPGTNNKIQIIATSATIGEDSADGNRKLAKYLADLAGVSEHELEEKVEVVRGYRDISSLTTPQDLSQTFSSNEAHKYQTESAEALFDYLATLPVARQLRRLFEGSPSDFAQHGLSISAALKLSDICKVAKTIEPTLTQADIINLLDLLTQAKRDGEAFVPLRLHLFQRTLTGLWACLNQDCQERDERLRQGDWPFGQVFIDHRSHCGCGAPVMELVSCSGCGSSYLAAEEYIQEGKSYLRGRNNQIDEDEFVLDQETDIESEDGEDEPTLGFERLVGTGGSHTLIGFEQVNEGQIEPTSGATISAGLIRPHLTESTGKTGFKCPCCDEKEYRPGTLFRHARLGAPFFLGDIIPTMLELSPLPKNQAEWQNPSFGKRLLTFTDSRQGTARLSARLQQEADRNANRTAIYHELVNLEVEEKQAATAEQITAVEQLAEQSKMFMPVVAVALEKVLSGSELEPNDVELIKSLKGPLAGQDATIDALDAVVASAGSSTAVPIQLSWQKLTSAFVGTSSSFNRRKQRLEKTSGMVLSDNEYADFSLYAEFSFRPKKTWSLETLGLVSIAYPHIQSISNTAIPSAWKRLVLDESMQLSEWKNFLKIVLDYYVRTNGAVYLDNNEYAHWLGTKRPRKLLKDPRIKVKQDRYDLLWPRIHDRGYNHIIKLLLAVFPQIEPEQKLWKDRVDELMQEAWRALSSTMKQRDAGVQLDLRDKAMFVSPESIWICPYTRKAIDVVLMGYSPYLSNFDKRAQFVAKQVTMPSIPARHWMDKSGEWTLQKRIEWLETNDIVNEARHHNIWPNRSDRLAVKEHWFSLEEHSAQQSPDTNKANEAKFKAGQLNVLNCSTTMEMGVDIGDMSLVAMNNVPPASANYMQRAGRAGRRGETAAAAVTLCKNTPHGMEVFANPLWPFTAQAQPPQVRLESESIVQRHINALALGSYLHAKTKNATTLNCEWFFEGADSHAHRFIVWIRSQHLETDVSQWASSVRALVKGTKLSHLSPVALAARVANAMTKVVESWTEQLDVMLLNIEELKSADPKWESSPAGKSVLFQLRDYRRAYLFGTLSTLAFLPVNGFPIGVVTFNYKTAGELERARISENEAKNTGQRSSRRFDSLPSRDLPTALREYAPGSDVVLNGKVYRSGGVQLGKVLSSGQELKQDSQHLPYYWHCHKCGAGATQHTYPSACTHCGTELKKSNKHQYLQPVGFATDIRYKPHNDVSETRQLPFNPPRVTLPASNWQHLPDPALGRYRYSSSGELYHYSAGENGHGFAVCLSCGRTESQYNAGTTPDSLRDPKLENSHYRLRGGSVGQERTDKICHGSIKKDLHLGYSARTEIIEVQLNDLDGNPLSDETQAWSLVVALREGLARKLGIESRELGFAVQQSKSAQDQVMYSLFIYDQSSGGAGYASQLAEHWKDVFKRASALMQCSCDGVCHKCLLSYDTQFVLENLDRISLAYWLSAQFYQRLALDDSDKLLGADSRFEPLSLPERVKLELGKGNASECFVRLSAHQEEWGIAEWSIFEDLMMSALQSKIPVTIIVEKDIFKALPETQRQQLATLINLPTIDATLLLDSKQSEQQHFAFGLRNLNGWQIWGTQNGNGLPMSANWGATPTRIVVNASYPQLELLGEPQHLALINKEKSPSDIRINFQHELDGPVDGFGERFWQMICQKSSVVKEALGAARIQSVHYNDRFLKSPHTVRVFGEIINELNQISSLDDALLTIRTNSINNVPSSQRLSFHDWNNDSMRAECLHDLLAEGYLGASVNGQISISEGDKTGFDVAHGRELTIQLEDGKTLYVILDYGLGYWKVDGYAGYAFNCSAEQQINQIANLNYNLVGSEFIGTYFIVGQSQG